MLVVPNRSITKKQLAFSIYANFTATEILKHFHNFFTSKIVFLNIK